MPETDKRYMIESSHRVCCRDSRNLSFIRPCSIGLVVTSPPYPMIEMWDELFCTFDPAVKKALAADRGQAAWEGMHRQLDTVWRELDRVVRNGGFVCINIGDATRKTGDAFQLYPSHARIIQTFCALGWQTLPLVLWRKTTNAPNKFMGSGMLPAGAYVTLEHEYILIFRKNGKREFVSETEKQQRRASAYFWEERNCWFSDTWNLAGIKQDIESAKSRERSAAYPFELAYRLINMYSVKGDTVLDPFLGTGTTTLAAVCSCRHSIGLEIDAHFRDIIGQQIVQGVSLLNRIIDNRLLAHVEFIRQYTAKGKKPQHENVHYRFPVVTGQEKELLLDKIHSIQAGEAGEYAVHYFDHAASISMACAQIASVPEVKPACTPGAKPPGRRRKVNSEPGNKNAAADQGVLDFGSSRE